GELEAMETPASEDNGADAAARFWRAFNHYDHGRCWFGETDEEEEAGSAAMAWDVRGPARFEAERERALRTGGSRLAAKVQPLTHLRWVPGDAGVYGRAAYTLQLLACLYALAEPGEAEARTRGCGPDALLILLAVGCLEGLRVGSGRHGVLASGQYVELAVVRIRVRLIQLPVVLVHRIECGQPFL